MGEAIRFETIDDIAAFRPRATVSLDEAIWLIKSAIESARERKIRQLIIDTTGLDGFGAPSVASRHLLAREGPAPRAVQCRSPSSPGPR